MSIRGVFFLFPNKERYFLKKILDGIPVEQFFWLCIRDQKEVYSLPELCIRDQKEVYSLPEVRFDKSLYKGDEFSKLIQEPYFLGFLKLEVYRKWGKFQNFHSYEEYLSSECMAVILIWDYEYVEIYSKDMEFNRKIFLNAQKLGYTELEYVTDDNDCRYKLDIR